MTEIAFHYNAPDKLGYACRLLRKAHAAGARLVVTGEPDLLARLDQTLWTFSALEFIPHCTARAEPMVLQASPVVLHGQPELAGHHEVLVNLGMSVPRSFERFERLIEVVTQEDADRHEARARWKHYADRGYQMVRHDLASPAS